MIRKVLWIILTVSYISVNAQVTSKKYPSLLWEISGNGLVKPSYLFGTMHVSNKLVFNLPDSFYYCIQQAQVVALENNPELWQEEMNKYDFGDLGRLSGYGGSYSGYNTANDYFTISDFQFNSFSKKLQWALSSNPSVLNNLLYRSYGSRSNDFEEDTYLDMYIYQIGKKLKKKITGVEAFKKSMQMAIEASLDMLMEKNKKVRSYSVEEEFSNNKLSEAYRTGNLDWLDTINKVNSRSDAYDEKFIYKRNDIQANSIDSIVKSGTSLFVGVGAAHLPGQRGVIELLRRKGYKLRPIKWGERSSEEKDRIDKIRMPITFSKQSSDDGFFSVNVPGKLYPSNDFLAASMGSQAQYADMANGSYYIVTRVQTNAALTGYSDKKVEAKLDSLLYENIPGKIISKTAISCSGYPGIEIINKTRRGDMQRYRIFITPYEVIFFKMSGIGDYITQGTEADTFFNSITLKPLGDEGWKEFRPASGGFAVSIPGDPVTFINNDYSLWSLTDKAGNAQYAIIRKDVDNYNFVEEDTFDLDLLNESFASSDFIGKTISKWKFKYKGYPAMEAKYSDQSGGTYQCRYIIQGSHYYALITHSKATNTNVDNFFNSFNIIPFTYGTVGPYADTAFSYTVKTPYYPKDKKEKINIVKNVRRLMEQYRYKLEDNDYDTSTNGLEIWEGIIDTKSIHNDTTGENIQVYYSKPPRYYYDKDSIIYKRLIKGDKNDEDNTWIIRSKKINYLPDGTATRYTVYSDTNSSRTIITKVFYKKGIVHTLVTESDTLSQPSAFVKYYFETLSPEINIQDDFNPFEKKSALFFKDYFNKDSVINKRAARFVGNIYLDSSDIPNIEKAIGLLTWKKNKRYIDKKIEWIKKLGNIPGKQATDYLKSLYTAANDTTELQNAILTALLAQQTQASFNTFKDIVLNEPPVVEASVSSRNIYSNYYDLGYRPKSSGKISYADVFSGLYDTLKLTKAIYPELLPLINLDDYKWKLMRLTSALLDSNQITGADYKIYFQKFLLEAKQELKKQLAIEKKSVIDAAAKNENTDDGYDEKTNDRGNTRLNTYTHLLLPYYDSNANVKLFFHQLLGSNDKLLKFDIYTLLLKNKKAVSDTLTLFFAANDDYRYRFYRNLQKMKKSNLFPEKYNNHIALAKSELLSARSGYTKPDSLIYIAHADTKFKNKSGLIYFFKYKLKKDDFGWKIAMAGLTPVNPNQYTFPDKSTKEDTAITLINNYYTDETANDGTSYASVYYTDYPMDRDTKLTSFSDVNINNDTPLKEQLNKVLNRELFTKHKSGKYFYRTEQSQRYLDMIE